MSDNLYNDIGGEEILNRVHRRFYEILFEDAWLGKFFTGKNPDVLVMKQTKFMMSCMGGPNEYQWETPAIAHMHMNISNELYDLRQSILKQCILDEGISEALAERWLEVDDSFRRALVKNSVEDCVTRVRGQIPIDIPKPAGYPWPKENDK